ncbi:hypothetical protein Bpfe_008609 [Biomphalaria pfeifferi]|uniref:Uncharacterized protein n=1 Tax=Biomphalaria pfeifferi TaxID=112525 RepID=A0AAD8BWT0_BIOPF|nr:hypothetical protein Bpfe_008609 [Biomphalaria pfeifferi]
MDEDQLPTKEKVDEDLLKECEKNPGHRKFLSLEQCLNEYELSSNLPEHYRKNVDKFKELIKHQADLTVQIVSGDKVGTGFVQKIDSSEICQCQSCKNSDSSNILKVLQISTAAHVLTEPHPDDQEKPTTTCIFFNDSKDPENIEFDAEKLVKSYESKETIYLKCNICRTDITVRLQNSFERFTELLKTLQYTYRMRKNSEELLVIIVSHPHGGRKRVTIGPRVETNHNNAQYEAATCRGSSGAFPVQIGGLVQNQPSVHVGCIKKGTEMNNKEQRDECINVSDVFIEKKILAKSIYHRCIDNLKRLLSRLLENFQAVGAC